VDLDAERIWVVKASLLLAGATFAFFVAAPGLLKYPLDFDQSIRILQIVLPVFVGYLGLATAFVFQNTVRSTNVYSNSSLIRLLLRGPIYVYSLGIVVVISVFWQTNLPGGAPASGMTIDQLAWLVSALVGLLAATTGLIVTKIFPTDEAKAHKDGEQNE